jgi:hypothetical protein
MEVEVRRFLRIAPLIALVFLPPLARAQVYGQYTGAPVLGSGGHQFGGYLDVSSKVVGLMAQLRLSFYPGVDFGFEGGPARITQSGASRGLLRLGTDIKVNAHHAASGANYDLSFGGALGVETGDNYNLLSLGPEAVISSPARANGPNGSGAVTPYAGVMLLFTNRSAGSLNDNGFSVPVRLGAEITATPGARISAEVVLRAADKFRDHAGFNVGVNLPF